ncbi:MAG: hypothetical protein FWF38_04010, partial [Spirochaetaceae bacterium]|nr:hypothetical protein [Spirochaetaceae bacterium]
LAEYLKTHGSEVLNMILTEWNTEDAIAFARKEEREEALQEGHEQGRAEGLADGLEQGRAEGLVDGQEKERKYFLELLDQGLSIDEIKKRISQKDTNYDRK